ncbi:MAG: hypothetical protein COV72_06715 [Candidatus Omnitrophica bacterium CG11_big_fil_rev_8_21_14_0_20_42_13]|uniref:Radical SAM core domain-containing protein n=1 Tax=Candidatus Ghiorseimicrobium undicola TaxID=1974746 RepID=A0A2H0LWE7_9BACT|nr:MAG: hypothetical protein COV72_06715 [Candidatus Omnitrophica bacterium CG11_big_fil_rev_8_21_14_0_20_42_13]
MSNIKSLPQNQNSKINIAYLRFRVDTVGQNFIYDEAERLNRYSPIVLCGNIERLDKKINYYCYEEFMKLYHHQWPIFPKIYEKIYRQGMGKFKEVINRSQSRLIHAQFLTDAIFCHRLIKESRLPLIINLRGHDLFVPQLRYFLPSFLPFVSKFVVKSESMKEELLSLGCEPSKIEVVYGGINIDRIIFKLRMASKNKIRILCAGRFVEKKGFDTTLKFFYRLLRAYPDATLTLLGEGRLKNNVVRLVKRLGIAERVNIKNFMDHQSFIKELYRHNLFLLPSKTGPDGDKEGIPNVLKEAMASGMPVISTYHSGIPELISDNETGYLVREDDHQAILDKVNFMLDNRERVFRNCLNARFFVEKTFDAKKTAQQMEYLYDYLLMPDFAKSIMNLNKGTKPSNFRVDLHLVKGCNSRCIMCDNWKSNINTSLTRKDISGILKHLKLFGANYVRFHGQEPTLRKDLFSIMKEAKTTGFQVGLKTNALVFTDAKKINALKGIVDSLYLSLDSPQEQVHNTLRGSKESFARNIYLAGRIKKICPDIVIKFNAVVTKFNYRGLDGLLDIAKELGINKVSFVHLNKKNKKNIGKLKLTRQEFREFYFHIWPRILKKSRDFGIPVSVDPYFYLLLRLPLELQIEKLKEYSAELEEEIDNFFNGLYGKKFYGRNVCYGVFDHVTIDWEGNVYPCCAMARARELSMGNLHEHNFLTLWNSDRYVKYRKSILRGDCKFKDECGRNFEKTVILNDCFKEETINVKADRTLMHLYSQNKYSKYISDYKFKRVIYYSFAKSKFYREKFKKLAESEGKVNPKGLPFVTRNELKHFFPKEQIMPNYFEENYGVYRTSSCGSNVFIYARPLNSDISSRISASFLNTGKWEVGQSWLKLTSLSCLEARHPLRKSFLCRRQDENIGRAIIIPPSDNFIDEPLSKIKKIYSLIMDSKAFLIHANPTYLKLLLFRFKKEKLYLSGQYIVHSTYETLLPSTKKLIQKYLNCRIVNQYGCSEVGPVSFSCRNGRNHVFSNSIHAEIIPDHNFKRMDIGRVVLTHLENHVMPFVKYFNGDFAYVTEKQECSCGLESPLIGDIVGREDEIINYNNKVVFPLELDRMFYDVENILIYQVFFENGQFFIKLVPEEKSGYIPVEKLEERFRAFFEDNKLKIHIEKKEFILPRRRGKYASVVIK